MIQAAEEQTACFAWDAETKGILGRCACGECFEMLSTEPNSHECPCGRTWRFEGYSHSWALAHVWPGQGGEVTIGLVAVGDPR
jgi:hypothetical protein